MIKFVLILIVLSVSLFSGYGYIFADDVVPTITIQPTKAIYYIGDLIFVNGTVSDVNWMENTDIIYEIYHSGEIVESVIEPLNNDEVFSFVIDTTDIVWKDFSGFCSVTVTIQNVTETTSGFYYPNEIDMTNESLYERSMDHEERISSNNSTLLTHRDMLNSHDPMIYKHDDLLIIQTNTINDLKLENEELRNQFKILGGYLLNLNVTLGQQYPAILDIKAVKEITNENKRLEDEIILFDKSIADTLILLDDAIFNNNELKIKKFTDAIGSDILSREVANSKLSMTYLYFDVYPQN